VVVETYVLTCPNIRNVIPEYRAVLPRNTINASQVYGSTVTI
jgi:hypothetical protein